MRKKDKNDEESAKIISFLDDVEDNEIKSEKSVKRIFGKRKLMAYALTATLAIAGASSFFYAGTSSNKAMTVLAKEEIRKATETYLTEMDSNGQMFKLTKDQISGISKQVSEVVTEDMLTNGSSASNDEITKKIESEVARILKEDRAMIALSDDEKESMANSVAAIVESKVADRTKSDAIKVSMVERSTTNVTKLQEQVNQNTAEIAELSNLINSNATYLANLSDSVTSYANSSASGSPSGDVSALYGEIKNLKDKIETMQDEYDSLSKDYSNARGTIYSLQVTSGSYASKDDINQVSEAVTDMNETLQLQVSTLMNQLAVLETTGGNGGNGSGNADVVSNADFQTLKSELENLKNDIQGASDALSKLVNLPEGGSLTEIVNQYISQQQENDKSLDEKYEKMKEEVEKLQSDSEDLGKMYKDYNELLKEYKQSAKNSLSLAQILATKGDKKDLDALRGYAQQINNQLVTEHNNMMEILYGGQKSVKLETESQNMAGAVNELKEKTDQEMSDICEIYRQIWGTEFKEDTSDEDTKKLLSDLDSKIQSANDLLNNLDGEYQGSDNSGQRTQITSTSTSLQQAITNVVSAYQTADNAIIDALKQETASRKNADESLQNQINELTNVTTKIQQSSEADTLSVKKAMGEYIEDRFKHEKIAGNSYIYYDGKELGGAGFYYVSATINKDEDMEGKVTKTTVSEAIANTNGKIGALIKVLEANEAFAQKYNLK